MTEPYIKANAGDTIRSTDWNEIQVRLRSEILSHTHSGGDQGTRLGGDGLNPATALNVRHVNATDILSVGPVGQPSFVVSTSGKVGIGVSDPGTNRLQVAGVLRADTLNAGKVITSAIEGLTSLSVGSFQATSISSTSMSAATLGVSGQLTVPAIEGVTSLNAATVQADTVVASRVTAPTIDGVVSLSAGTVQADNTVTGAATVQGNALVRGALAVGPGLTAPKAPLDISLGDVTDKWQRFVVSLSTRWDGASQQVTLGAVTTTGSPAEQLTAGIMLSNPHVPWFKEESRASVRYGLAGGVATGSYWDAGVRADASFSFVCYPNRSGAPASLTPLTVTSEGKLGIGVVPLGTSANQVQIAGGHLHLGGNALFLRAPGASGWEDQYDVVKWSSNGDIVEAAGAQGIALGYTSGPNTVTRVLRVHPDCVELGPGVAGKEVNAGKIGYQKLTSNALDIVGAGTSATTRRVKVWAEGGTVFTGDVSTTRLGVGTDTPATELVIRKDLKSALGPILTLLNGAGYPGAAVAIDFNGYQPPAGASPTARLMSADDGNFSSHLLFLTKVPGANTNALAERLRITAGGNVGVGAASPAALLSVGASSQFQVDGSGNVSTSGSLTVTSLAAYQAVFTSATKQLTTGTLGVAMGGTGATTLTGVLRGNGTGAFSAMNGAAGLVARWTDANTLGTGALTDTGTSVAVAGGLSVSGTLTATGIINAGGGLAITGTLRVGTTTATMSQKLMIDDNGGIGFAGTGLNATDKKLWSPSDGLLRWQTNSAAAAHGFEIGSQALAAAVHLDTNGNSWLTGGNVAIGATDPAGYMLRVNGNVLVDGGLVMNGTDLTINNASRRGTAAGANRRALTHDTGDSLTINYAGDYTGGVTVSSALTASGLVTAEGGLAVAPGAAVSGVQVIDFKGVTRTFSGHTGAAWTGTGTVAFSQPVVKAFIVQTGWLINYDNGREVVNKAGVQLSVTSVSGTSVTYSITVSLKDNTGTFDDPYSGDIRFNIVAVLQSAV